MAKRSSEPVWRPRAILITCEHAGREIPPRWRRHFRGASEILRSHRGLDIGAFDVALALAEHLAAPLIFSRTSRLLIELNRSLDHPRLFSEYTRDLDESERA
ncbi:MAG: N-formylglutamate amidohydrolase, partial [Planctomycetota bacterium]|nr:N-formylglutamate amidohydrolase [Planctomycetota bacterium]